MYDLVSIHFQSAEAIIADRGRSHYCFFPKSNLSIFPHHDDNKVQPAPGVGEVLDEPQGQPLDAHLKEEDHREDAVHVVQDILQDL